MQHGWVYGLLTLGALGAVETQGQERKNVLLILVDDMQRSAVRHLGATTPGSAVINGLIDRSAEFERCYTMGSIGGALSMPSRAMLMTGRTLYELDGDGRTIDPNHKTLPETLRGAGYETFATGKWHSDHAAFHRSFSTGEHLFFGGMHPYDKGGHAAPILQHYDSTGSYPAALRYVGDRFSSEMYAGAAVDFLEHRTGEQPFFCYVAFTSPHDPHNRLPAYSQPLERVVLPPNFLPAHPFDNGELGVRDEMVLPAPRSIDSVAKHNAWYGGMINEVGIQIGRVLEALERSGQADRTIIVFASDNGLAMGQHGLMGKQSLYDHSARVPMAIYVPGRGARQVDGLCYLSDIAPTIYDLVGVKPPKSTTSPSLKKAIDGGETERSAVMLTYSSLQRAVVWNDWKYVIYRVKGVITEQLFDLKNDPWERNNRAVELPEKTAQYRARLVELMGERGDFCNLDNPLWWSDGHKISWDEGINFKTKL